MSSHWPVFLPETETVSADLAKCCDYWNYQYVQLTLALFPFDLLGVHCLNPVRNTSNVMPVAVFIDIIALGLQLPNSSQGKPWFWYVDKTVTVELLNGKLVIFLAHCFSFIF